MCFSFYQLDDCVFLSRKKISELIAMMMEAASASETSVNFYHTTRRYNPEDSNLRTHRCKNPKYYSKEVEHGNKFVFYLFPVYLTMISIASIIWRQIMR
jgi:hypothetical protein